MWEIISKFATISPMKLILIRHGEIDASGNLTDKGRWQAKQLAHFLSEQAITTIFCSPTDRCEATMIEIIKNREEISDIRFSRLVEAKMKKESYSFLNKRVAHFVEDLYAEFGDEDTVVVVTHNLVIRMFVYYLAKIEAIIEHGSVTIFEINENEAKKIMLNETGFLK